MQRQGITLLLEDVETVVLENVVTADPDLGPLAELFELLLDFVVWGFER